jgi:nucleoid DNA-binding protein
MRAAIHVANVCRTSIRGPTWLQVREALHGILDLITDEMAEGNAVTMAGFGCFEAKEHKARRVVGLDGSESAQFDLKRPRWYNAP